MADESRDEEIPATEGDVRPHRLAQRELRSRASPLLLLVEFSADCIRCIFNWQEVRWHESTKEEAEDTKFPSHIPIEGALPYNGEQRELTSIRVRRSKAKKKKKEVHLG